MYGGSMITSMFIFILYPLMKQAIPAGVRGSTEWINRRRNITTQLLNSLFNDFEGRNRLYHTGIHTRVFSGTFFVVILLNVGLQRRDLVI